MRTISVLAFAGILTLGPRATWAAPHGPSTRPDFVPAVREPRHPPHLVFSLPRSQDLLGAAYRDALTNLLDTNTVPDDSARYDQTGLLSAPPGTFIRAGGGYMQPWTRDASVNSWNAASLLEPAVARNTLWAVVQRQRSGALIVQQDDEWWDQVVWIAAAWNQYAVTGDRTFLTEAYQAATETLAHDRALRFRSGYGLFEGPGFLNDGIAGYPVPPATPTEDRGSFVLKYPHADELMVLSTNCLYAQAYRSAAAMARALADSAGASVLTATADSLEHSINRRFWIADEHTYGYLIHGAPADSAPPGGAPGTLDPHQEASGLAFALLFDVADSARARDVLEHVHIDPHGIADVYPSFPRYGPARPGRHNESVWPMVEGFWALAAAHRRDASAFAWEVRNLAGLATSSSGHFYEIYNAWTGVPDGGWQTGSHWKSEPDQTWSATAYLAMIYRGLFGMEFTAAGIELRPLLPAGWGDVALTGLRYRGMSLGVRLHGAGCAVTRFAIDGQPRRRAFVPDTLTGAHSVDITLQGGCRK